MDEFDEINPFGDEFRPDALTPEPSPSPTSSQSSFPPLPPQELLTEGLLPESSKQIPKSPPPSYQEVDSSTKTKKTKKEVSTEIRTIRMILRKYGSDPNYKVKDKKSKYYGHDLNKLKNEEIKFENLKQQLKREARVRERTQQQQPLSTQLKEKRRH